MLMDCIVHLVLYTAIEEACGGGILVVVDGGSVNVGQLLIETTLREANLALSLQKIAAQPHKKIKSKHSIKYTYIL